MTCAENVALPLRKHKSSAQGGAHRAEARKRLEQVHMQDFAEPLSPELGDGMRKRVAIARALTLDPRYVLFDEPTTQPRSGERPPRGQAHPRALATRWASPASWSATIW